MAVLQYDWHCQKIREIHVRDIYIEWVLAMVVRFTTRRYIGEYDPTLERIYTYATVIDKELVSFEILDTAGQTGVSKLVFLYFLGTY